MSLVSLMFYIFESLAALSALCLIFVRNVFYAALLLIVCLLSIAAIYVLAFAEFVAVTQILVYAGGVLVVMLFGVMLTTKISGKPLVIQHGNIFSGILAGSLFFCVLIYYLNQSFSPAQATTTVKGNTIENIGVSLMTQYLLPFEIAGILLLIALVGSAVIASAKPEKNN